MSIIMIVIESFYSQFVCFCKSLVPLFEKINNTNCIHMVMVLYVIYAYAQTGG